MTIIIVTIVLLKYLNFWISHLSIRIFKSNARDKISTGYPKLEENLSDIQNSADTRNLAPTCKSAD